MNFSSSSSKIDGCGCDRVYGFDFGRRFDLLGAGLTSVPHQPVRISMPTWIHGTHRGIENFGRAKMEILFWGLWEIVDRCCCCCYCAWPRRRYAGCWIGGSPRQQAAVRLHPASIIAVLAITPHSGPIARSFCAQILAHLLLLTVRHEIRGRTHDLALARNFCLALSSQLLDQRHDIAVLLVSMGGLLFLLIDQFLISPHQRGLVLHRCECMSIILLEN
jgi:hypothetical protein